MSGAWGYGLRAEEAGLRPDPTKDRDATAGDLPGDGLPRLVPHDRKTGGSGTRPYAGGMGRRLGHGCRRVWFDTVLRKTSARLTTNGWGRNLFWGGLVAVGFVVPFDKLGAGSSADSGRAQGRPIRNRNGGLCAGGLGGGGRGWFDDLEVAPAILGPRLHAAWAARPCSRWRGSERREGRVPGCAQPGPLAH